MNIKEARVGNVFKIDGVICKADERTIFDWNNDGRVKEPVPVTVIGLEQIGFEYIESLEMYQLEYKFAHIDSIQLVAYHNYYRSTHVFLIDEKGSKIVEFHYIHQVQNFIDSLNIEP